MLFTRTKLFYDILETFPLIIIAFIISILSIATFGWISQLLYIENYIDPTSWNPIATVASITNLIIAALTIFNASNNYYYRNLFLKTNIQQPLVIYFIVLPLIILFIIWMVLCSILDYYNLHCNDYGNLLFSLTTIIFYISIVVVIFDVNGKKEYGENWYLVYLNFLTTTAVSIQSLMYGFFNFWLLQINKFLNVIDMHEQNKCKNVSNVSIIINNIVQKMNDFSYGCNIIIGISVFIILYEYIKRFYLSLVKINKKKFQLDNLDITFVSNTEPINYNKKYSCISISISILLGLLIMFASLFVYNKYFNAELETLFYLSTLIFTYIILIIVTIYMLYITKDWLYKVNFRYKNHVILSFIGLCGQLIQTFSLFLIAVTNLTMKRTIFYEIVIIKSIFQLVQNISQFMFELIIIDKHWQLPRYQKSFVKLFSCTFLCTIINTVIIISNYVEIDQNLDYYGNGYIHKDIVYFANIFTIIGSWFTLVHRFNGAIIAGSLTMYLYRGLTL